MMHPRLALALALLLAACGTVGSEGPPSGGDAKPSPDTRLDDRIDLSAPSDALLSQAIFEATNAARAGEGLGALLPCAPCQQAAQQHADDMARLDFFSHENPDPNLASPGDRLDAAGLTGYSGWAENIAMYPARTSSGVHTYRSFAASVLDGWMNSSGHRANILSPQLTHLGDACAVQSASKVLCVQDFARLSNPR